MSGTLHWTVNYGLLWHRVKIATSSTKTRVCVSVNQPVEFRTQTTETRDDEVMIRHLVEKFTTANGQKPAWLGGDILFVTLMRKLMKCCDTS